MFACRAFRLRSFGGRAGYGHPDIYRPLRPGLLSDTATTGARSGRSTWRGWTGRPPRAAIPGKPGRSGAGNRGTLSPRSRISPAGAGAVAGPLFAEDAGADTLPPGPLLAALTEQAVCDVGRLSDEELVGVLRASQRLMAREQYKQVLAAAEFGRRRQAAFDDALRRGVPAGCAPGGFPGEELAVELTVSRAEAAHLTDDAIDLTARLPRTLGGMAAGLVDAGRAGWIAMYTRGIDLPARPGRMRSSRRRRRSCGPSSWPARPPRWK